MSALDTVSVQYLKGVGPAKKKLFSRLGVETIEDLLYFFPRRYEDRRRLTPLGSVKPGEFQTACGKVAVRGGRRSWYTKKHVYELVLDDGTGRLFCVWFNQPYLERYFLPGRQVVVYGKVEVYKNRLQMVSPEYEVIAGEEDRSLSMGRIVPIYPLTKGISQRTLRKVIRACLDRYRDELTDILPVWVRNKHRLMNIRAGLENLHYPQTMEKQQEAHRRLSFEEFFVFQLSALKRRMLIGRRPGVAHRIDQDMIGAFETGFPFALTGAQKRVIGELAGDMQAPFPMLRLLQGDVGSGKTVVALFGCAAAIANGHQAAIMAPTEILARQHYESVMKLLSTPAKQANRQTEKLETALLVGSMKKKEKDEVLAKIQAGDVDLVIGTHALLNEEVDFRDLSFAVIDEQHKFGVKQRSLLADKGRNPDVLVMTATPIPRTLTLTLFGDLDVSVIDELPPGRQAAETRVYPFEQEQEVYELVRRHAHAGGQAYLVYPLVEESEKKELRAAEAMFRRFHKEEFAGIPLGLVHGQMPRRETDAVMTDFRRGKIAVLVATTVLEVGVDIPNATMMVIEHAEHFGLSQLHQLRGRVGRGSRRGMCLLIADDSGEEAGARLKAIVGSTDGFQIAEQDLLIRGPGQYFGRQQHGLNELKYANPALQVDILEQARREAQEVLHADPDLADRRNAGLQETIRKRYPGYLSLAGAG